MSQQKQAYARAEAASIQGLGAQLLMSAALFALGSWSRSGAVTAAAYYALSGVPVWICLWIIHRLHKLERARALESGPEGERDESGGAIGSGGVPGGLASARRALWSAYRFAFPLASLVTGTYLAGSGVYLLWFRLPRGRFVFGDLSADPLVCLALTAGLAFVGFIAGRYLAGLARVREWQLLQAGASYLMGSTLLTSAIAVGFALAHFEFVSPLRYLAKIIPVLSLAVGAEIALFFLLGFYRPRRPGEIPRPAFNSRLLGLLSNPEGIGKTVADTINYQFGFEVSRSWLLQLLARAAWPLIGLSAGSLLLLSCLVIVEPHQQALVTRFGRVLREPLGPGIHPKAPWPIDSAELYDVARVRKIHVGSHKPAEPGGEILKADVPVLWSNIHGVAPEQLLIVAPPRDLLASQAREGASTGARTASGRAGVRSRAPSISLVGGDIFVEFRISDLLGYVTHEADPERRFRQIAEMEASRELYQFDVDTLMAEGRMAASAALRERIQKAADRAGLGIEVMLVGFAGVHPPQEVADAFHETVAAEQERETAIQDARRFAITLLAEAAGTVEYAGRLAGGIEQLERLVGAGAKASAVTRQEEVIERLLREAGGIVAEKVALARGYRWWKENSERGKAQRFERQIITMRTAPLVYRVSYYLGVLERGLADARKYILVGDRERLILRFDFKDVSEQLRDASGSATEGGHRR